LVYGLWHRTSARFFGETGLYDVSGSRCTVGYWLRATARGHGFVDEALSALEQHAFRVLRLTLIEAHIAPENLASRRVVERRGYQAISARPANAQWDGETDTMLVYQLVDARHHERHSQRHIPFPER